MSTSTHSIDRDSFSKFTGNELNIRDPQIIFTKGSWDLIEKRKKANKQKPREDIEKEIQKNRHLSQEDIRNMETTLCNEFNKTQKMPIYIRFIGTPTH